jgi:hypothetical protein
MYKEYINLSFMFTNSSICWVAVHFVLILSSTSLPFGGESINKTKRDCVSEQADGTKDHYIRILLQKVVVQLNA